LAAEAVNAAAVTSEETRALAAEAANAQAVTDETTRALAAEATLLPHTDGSHTGTLSTEHIQLDSTSYLYFGSKWRVAGSVDGTRLVFEYNKGTELFPDYVAAVPFITTLV
jgi:hypothetical protein